MAFWASNKKQTINMDVCKIIFGVWNPKPLSDPPKKPILPISKICSIFKELMGSWLMGSKPFIRSLYKGEDGFFYHFMDKKDHFLEKYNPKW